MSPDQVTRQERPNRLTAGIDPNRHHSRLLLTFLHNKIQHDDLHFLVTLIHQSTGDKDDDDVSEDKQRK